MGFVLCLLIALVAGRTVSVRAAVLPQARIDAALASAKNLHRRTIPNTVLHLPYYVLDGTEAQGFVDRDGFDYGFLTNGADLLIVPLASGGSGGVFSTLLFTGLRTSPKFVGAVPSASGHLDVHIERGQLIVRTPVYRKSDPNCCPSGHHVVTYALVNGKLKKLDEYNPP